MVREVGGKLGECGIHVGIYGEWSQVIFRTYNLAG